MFRQLSKITSKYTSSLFSHYYHQDPITPNLIESWLKDTQAGLDALLNDQMMSAEDIFSSSSSPFHAFGHALLIYAKAMLSTMERSKIDQAIDSVANVQFLLKRILSSTVRIKKHHGKQSTLHPSFSAPSLDHYASTTPSTTTTTTATTTDLQLELMYANCILMSATLQFLKESWIDHLKAAYELRKAYKMYERLFETVTGMTLVEYDRENKPSRVRRTVSLYHNNDNDDVLDETVEHGAYFGIGLFNVIFSLLPIKVKKILNGLGFHSSRRTAIQLLQKAHGSETMYSSLSALVLLIFYTDISTYLYPHINTLFTHEEATTLLQRMKSQYPSGYIWILLEGKLNRKGSIRLFEQVKNANHGFEKQSMNADFRTVSITELSQFRSLTLYELGWSYILAGEYVQACETFFCLISESTSWSRVFYHYLATCCMLANQSYDKSILEIRQIVLLLDSQKKLSVQDQFAEAKIRHWLSSEKNGSLRETLQSMVIHPLWELVYLCNGVGDFCRSIREEIELHEGVDPFLFLLQGVIARDHRGDTELALMCFHKTLTFQSNWIPYAMYEIAVTHVVLFQKGQILLEDHQSSVTDWILCIEEFYQTTSQIEWDTRMQLKCQLLTESCYF